MKKYRLVSYSSRGNRYLQIVRDIKREDGGWTTKIVTHIGSDTEWNRRKAEDLIDFLVKYASDQDAPIAIGTIDEDFLAGFRLGILLGRSLLPIPSIFLFGDFIHSLNCYIESSGSIEQAVNATQPRLTEEEKRKIAEWIKSIPEDRDKAIALFFKWSAGLNMNTKFWLALNYGSLFCLARSCL